jgi:hypothetical protein
MNKNAPIIYSIYPSVDTLDPLARLHVGQMLHDFLKNFIYGVVVEYTDPCYHVLTFGGHTTIPLQIKLTIYDTIYKFDIVGK